MKDYNGDDVEFMQRMIPHHQAAIAMAHVVLGVGKSAEVEALAMGIIKAQKAEIALMRAWLKERGENEKPGKMGGM